MIDPFKDPPDLKRIARAALELGASDILERRLSTPCDERVSHTEMVEAQSQSLLVGGAGSGKSVLFAQMVASAARSFLDVGSDDRCPILISVNELARMVGEADYQTLVHGNVLLSLSEFTSLASSGQIALWLDGFDEIASAGVNASDLWELISNAKSIVISTRPPAHQAFSEWTTFELQPLSSNDVHQLTHILSKDERIANEFSRTIEQHEGLLDLTRSPLLLKMMLEVFYFQGSLPTNPATLYSILIDTYVNSWDAKRSSINILNRADRLYYLSGIACAMYERGEYALYHSDIELILRSGNDANLRAVDIWSDISTVGLMHRLNDGRFQFSHKSLMMYLVAFHHQRNPAGLASLLRQNDSSWLELVSFIGALADQVDDLVDAFCSLIGLPKPPSAYLLDKYEMTKLNSE